MIGRTTVYLNVYSSLSSGIINGENILSSYVGLGTSELPSKYKKVRGKYTFETTTNKYPASSMKMLALLLILILGCGSSGYNLTTDRGSAEIDCTFNEEDVSLSFSDFGVFLHHDNSILFSMFTLIK